MTRRIYVFFVIVLLLGLGESVSFQGNVLDLFFETLSVDSHFRSTLRIRGQRVGVLQSKKVGVPSFIPPSLI